VERFWQNNPEMHGRKNELLAPSSASDVPQSGFLTAQADGVALAIKLQPRAAKNEITAIRGPELRIKVTAPPVDAAANEALLRLLADTLDCPRGKITLIRGQTSRHKIVKVSGLSATEVLTKLRDA